VSIVGLTPTAHISLANTVQENGLEPKRNGTWAGDTPTSGAAREAVADSVGVALIVTLILVACLMTTFWLCMVMIYCRRRCQQKAYDKEWNANHKVQKL
jgi:heme/copper-type cytochrome/quinol oxidase subunit 2